MLPASEKVRKEKGKSFSDGKRVNLFAIDPFLRRRGKGEQSPTFFSVSRSQRRFLQIWWLFSFLQGAQSPQLSFLWQPEHSPHRFRFFFVGFSCVSASSPLVKRLLSQGDHRQGCQHEDHHPDHHHDQPVEERGAQVQAGRVRTIARRVGWRLKCCGKTWEKIC